MKSAYFKQLLVFIYILNLMSLSACAKEMPQEIEDKFKRQAEKEMQENPNTTVSFGSKDVYGMTIYYYKSGQCQRPGIDCPQKAIYFRENYGFVVADNQYYAVKTYDMINGDSVNRIDFSNRIINLNQADNLQKNNVMSEFIFSNLQGGENKYEKLADYYPQLKTGIAEAAVDIQKSIETTVSLHRFAQQQEQKFYDDLYKKYKLNMEQHLSQSVLLQQQLRDIMANGFKLIDPNYHFNNKNPFAVKNDPTSFREYEFDEQMSELLDQQVIENLNTLNFPGLMSNIEAGIYQKDKQASEKFQYKYSKYVKDGLIQYSEFGFPLMKPFERHKYQSKIDTHGGQVIRRLANQINYSLGQHFDNLNNPTYIIDALLTASAMLQSADHFLVSNEDARGFEMLTLAESIYAATKGLIRGFGQGIVQNFKALPDLAILVNKSTRAILVDPKGSVQYLRNIFQSLPGFLPAVASTLQSYVQEFIDGGVETKARIFSRVGTEVFISVLVGGTTSAVNATERVALLKSAEIVQLKNLVKKKPDIVNEMMQLSANQIEVVKAMSTGNRIDALGSLLKKHPGRALDVDKAMKISAESGNINAANYVMKLVQSPQLPYQSVDNIYTDITNEYIRISSKAGEVPVSQFNGTVTRAIPSEVKVGENVIANTIDDVFKEHPGMKSSNGRFSHGGAEGNSVMYTTIGDSEIVRETVIVEAGLKVQDRPIISSTTMSFNRVWDLTNQNTLSSLGISIDHLIMNSIENNKAYFYPQMITDIASANGVEAIISHSAVDKSGLIKNLIIFNGVK